MTGFGDRLKTARGDETQASFAKRLGISQVAYSRYESGQREPSLDCLYQIGLLTGVSADWLLGLTEERSAARGAGASEADWRSRARAAEAKLERVSRALAHALKGFEELQEAVK